MKDIFLKILLGLPFVITISWLALFHLKALLVLVGIIIVLMASLQISQLFVNDGL